MQTGSSRTINKLVALLLAVAIATSPFASIPTYARTQPQTVRERLSVMATRLTEYFRHKDPVTNETFDTTWTTTVVKGTDEVATTGEIMDNSTGKIIFVADGVKDGELIERVQQSPNADNIELIDAQNPEQLVWRGKIKNFVVNKLKRASAAAKSLAQNASFQAIALSAGGNALGYHLNTSGWISNTPAQTAAAISLIVFLNGIFSNIAIRGFEPYPWLLEKGANAMVGGFEKAGKGIQAAKNAMALFKKAMGGRDGAKTEVESEQAETQAVGWLARAISYLKPSKETQEKMGMVLAGIGVAAVPTGLIYAVTEGNPILSAGMFFATLRNAWDVPIDVVLQNLHLNGTISYRGKKLLMGLKSAGGPVIDTLASTGVTGAVWTAFTMATGGVISVFASKQVGNAFLASAHHGRRIASKSKELGLQLANSFSGKATKVADAVIPKRREAVRRHQLQAAVSAHVRTCAAMLAGYEEKAQAWAGRHIRLADDVN